MATRLSVNLNKVALIRNSRGEGQPDLLRAARVALSAGCGGLTLHPREDRRHALIEDIVALADLPEVREGRIELNIEGDTRRDLMDAIKKYPVAQFTMVPVAPGEITTTRGISPEDDMGAWQAAIREMQPHTRISVFADPTEESVRLAKEAGADCVEFHTKHYAHTFGSPANAAEVERLVQAARIARELGLQVNAGHDLNRENLPLLLEAIQPDEVSIGHALVSDALFEGLEKVVGDYVGIVGTTKI